MKTRLILAIETALKSGSIAILNDDKVLCSRVFEDQVSMSKNLVDEVKQLINITGFNKSDLNLIAVSNGPGSLTGIRIGISVGLGLGLAFGIECMGISLLKAFKSVTEQTSVITFVPAGRQQSYCQFFEKEKEGEIKLIKNETISLIAEQNTQKTFVIYNDLFEETKKSFDGRDVICPLNAAELLGKTGYKILKKNITNKPSPIYLQQNLFKKNTI